MEMIRAVEYGKDAKMIISQIFVDGFYPWLRFYSKDKGKLTRAFAHMFNLENFFMAVINEEIAGIAACTDGAMRSVYLNPDELKKHLGFFMGSIASITLKKEFEQKKYPFKMEKGMGLIEFVATSVMYRNKGVASAIMHYIFESTPYREYVLEVADTNTNAIKLYQKLGYKEFTRIRTKHGMMSGIYEWIYMKYVKNN